MVAEVSGGRVQRVRGAKDVGLTGGFLCNKVARYERRVHHPDRVLRPRIRSGPKGQGHFRDASWEEALALVAQRLGEITSGPHGPQAILPYSYSGTIGPIQGESMDRRFFGMLGASRLDRTICATAGMAGFSSIYGETIGTDPEEVHRAQLIVVWGSNTLTSNVHLWPQVQAARNAGAKLVVVDVYRTRTAHQADEFLAVRPGTDAALALSIAHVMLEEGWHDQGWCADHVDGLEAFAARAAEFPPERAEQLCGVAATRIRALAREIATAAPAFFRINYGLQRTAGGANAVRAVCALPALSGAWRHPGGGILLSTSGNFPLRYDLLHREDLWKPARTVNMVPLGRALAGDVATLGGGPPVQALFVYGSNPAVVAPEQARVLEGLAREDLFTVVHEQFPTETAAFADVLLPATTQLEQYELMKPYGHYNLVMNQPAIAPVGESVSNTELFRRLAGAMGMDHPVFRDDDLELIRQFLESEDPRLEGITLEGLLERGAMRLSLPTPYAPFAEGGFPTPHGKVRLHDAELAAQGLDPLPAHVPPREPAGEGGRLALVTPAAHHFLNSSFANLADQLRREGEPTLLVNPGDARDRGLQDGAWARLHNARGECWLRVVCSADAPRGVVVHPTLRWNRDSPGGRGINQLTSAELTDIGAGATFYDCAVELEASEGPPAAVAGA